MQGPDVSLWELYISLWPYGLSLALAHVVNEDAELALRAVLLLVAA
jgi:hypothetical protein